MPTLESDLQKIRRYRERAEECRVHAAQMKDPDARDGLYRVANAYDNMADTLEGG